MYIVAHPAFCSPYTVQPPQMRANLTLIPVFSVQYIVHNNFQRASGEMARLVWAVAGDRRISNPGARNGRLIGPMPVHRRSGPRCPLAAAISSAANCRAPGRAKSGPSFLEETKGVLRVVQARPAPTAHGLRPGPAWVIHQTKPEIPKKAPRQTSSSPGNASPFSGFGCPVCRPVRPPAIRCHVRR